MSGPGADASLMAAVVGIGLIAVGGIIAVANSESTDDAAELNQYCADSTTDLRLDDDACGEMGETGLASTGGTYFVYVPVGSQVPPVGGYAYQFTSKEVAQRAIRNGATIGKGVAKSGGTAASSVQRGGLGVKAGTSSGGGAKSGSSAGS